MHAVDALCVLATHASREEGAGPDVGTHDHTLHTTALCLACVNRALQHASEAVLHIQGANDRLKRAVAIGDCDDMEAALALGASVQTWPGDPFYGALPLHLAVACGELEAVQLLLSRGADPCRVDEDGRTALHCLATGAASKLEAQALVEAMVGAGADVHARDAANRTPLSACCRAYWTVRGPDPCLQAPIQALIRHGATPTARNLLYLDFM